MNNWTRFGLVCLRLAIGWLFLFEGIEKVESIRNGPTSQTKPFSSEGYLREASGPAASLIKDQIGDPDADALARLVPLPPSANNELSKRVPPALASDWEATFQSFTGHFALSPEQLAKASNILSEQKTKLGEWLTSGVKDVDRPLGESTVKLRQSTPARVKEYQEKLKELQDSLSYELPAFMKDVKKEKLAALKGEVRKYRSELLSDLSEQTAKLNGALESVLTPEQKAQGAPPPSETQAATMLRRADMIVIWGVFIIGVALMAGLFTRLTCVAGALFLAMLYVAMPPIPGVPDPGRVEGHYYFVSKNLIMMIALLTLATTRSGEWLGLDGLIRFLRPSRRRGSAIEDEREETSRPRVYAKSSKEQ